jgi:predicted nucleotidyltransferase
MKDRVFQEIGRIEEQYQCRVLLAVESGSRAWGFASPDSDYDVRFIYAHRPQWYLSVFEQRDVIEEMLPGDLDVSGWELRKTLRLFSKCNLALNEWLGSDVVYREIPEFKRQLAALIPAFFNPIAATHHYRSMAESAFADNYIDGRIPIKRLFYTLRPLLACRWIESTGTQPPTDFHKLVATSWVSDDERNWIGQMLQEKAKAVEVAPTALERSRAERISVEIEKFKSLKGLAKPIRGQTLELDRVLRDWVR